MNETEITDDKEEFDRLLQKGDTQTYLLRLYIAGMTDKSAQAVQNIRKICDENLNGRYELEVIDIYQQPELAHDAQIIAAPMLVKKLPLPLRRLIGDMTDKERILVGLDLRPK
ncbi:MAG: circadian clock KaiB family protein [Candidatus Methanoperedens sp.]|nr:circadian clock KaiB family protein [Candidatus Methanoperedens sp.]